MSDARQEEVVPNVIKQKKKYKFGILALSPVPFFLCVAVVTMAIK